MNKFQLEVDEMDRRHHLKVRTATGVGAASLIAAALWSAGIPSAQWLEGLHRRWMQTDPQTLLPVDEKVQTLSAAQETSTSLPQSADPALGNASSASPSPQSLFLVGVNPGRNSREGTALLGTNPENPQTYVAGAILANGAMLAEIHSDRVIVERNGQRLILRLSKDVGVSLQDRGEGVIDLAMIGGQTAPILLQAGGNARELTDVIRGTAHFEEDQLIGLKVYAGRHSGLFAQLGLKAGDIITAIDGATVIDPVESLRNLESLTQGAAVTVSVQRGTESHVLSLDGSIVEKVFEASPAVASVASAGPP